MRRSVLALTVAQLAGDEDRLFDAMRPAGQANASRASRQADTRAAAMGLTPRAALTLLALRLSLA